MANNYTQSSFALDDLTKAETEWLRQLEGLAEQTTHDWDMSKHEEEWRSLLSWGGDLLDFDWGWTFEFYERQVIIYAEESGGLSFMEWVMQAFLKKFRPTQAISFEWAYSCSKMRPNEFGGGASFVTAYDVKDMGSSWWVNQQQAKFDTLQEWFGDA